MNGQHATPRRVVWQWIILGLFCAALVAVVIAGVGSVPESTEVHRRGGDFAAQFRRLLAERGMSLHRFVAAGDERC